MIANTFDIKSGNRSSIIQIMRGLAIVMVLFHHAISKVEIKEALYVLDQIIICFHMPIFFMISGYLFQNGLNRYFEKGKGIFILRKARHLLLPYVFWTIFLWLGIQIACVLSSSIASKMSEIGFDPMSVEDLLYGLFTYQVYYTEHLWFLYVLFVLFVINIILANLGSSGVSLIIWLFIGISSLFVSLPHIIERTMLWGIFFTFGRIIRSQDILEKMSWGGGGKRFSIRKICVLLVFFAASTLRIIGFNFGLTGMAASVTVQLVKYVIGFAGCGVIYFIASLIKSARSGDVMKTVGDYSFDIYLMHNPYCVALCAVLLNQIIGVSAYITVVIATILGVVVPMVASRFVIRKSRLLSMVMIGK